MDNTYAIDPQVKPTRRYPRSEIERAVGAPNPVVSSLVAEADYLRLNLKSPSGVEKKNVLGSVESNSSSKP